MSRPVRYGYGDAATWPSVSFSCNDPRIDNEALERLQEAAFEAGMTVKEFLRRERERAESDYFFEQGGME